MRFQKCSWNDFSVLQFYIFKMCNLPREIIFLAGGSICPFLKNLVSEIKNFLRIKDLLKKAAPVNAVRTTPEPI